MGEAAVAERDVRDTIEHIRGLDTRVLLKQAMRYQGIARSRGLLPAEAARQHLVERVLRERTDGRHERGGPRRRGR